MVSALQDLRQCWGLLRKMKRRMVKRHQQRLMHKINQIANSAHLGEAAVVVVDDDANLLRCYAMMFRVGCCRSCSLPVILSQLDCSCCFNMIFGNCFCSKGGWQWYLGTFSSPTPVFSTQLGFPLRVFHS